MSPQPARTPSRAWLVWGVALAVYLLAVFHRTSLGVAGLVAAERFDLSASQLGSFTMVQLLVYAAMQVPVGLLVDRFGARTVLTVGLATMSISQAGFGLATSYPEALLARTCVGIGDAMTFICVLRLVNSWFVPRQIPLITQLTGSTGQIGAIVAAVPMTLALDVLGWTRTYLVAAAVGGVLLIVVFAVLGDEPGQRHLRGQVMSWGVLSNSLRASWAQPGTRLGFWVHFATPFSAHMLSLLWGYPFLVLSEGRSATTAGLLLSVIVAFSVISGPLLGWLVGSQPWHRSTVSLSAVASMAITWAVVLCWPGAAPLWLLVILMAAVGFAAPVSMVGFDMGRTSNPTVRLASATGLINQGGFVAALIAVVAVGVVLDAATPGGSTAYTPGAFQAAMSVQYLLWGVGAFWIWRLRRELRRRVPRDVVEGGSTMIDF